MVISILILSFSPPLWQCGVLPTGDGSPWTSLASVGIFHRQWFSQRWTALVQVSLSVMAAFGSSLLLQHGLLNGLQTLSFHCFSPRTARTQPAISPWSEEKWLLLSVSLNPFLTNLGDHVAVSPSVLPPSKTKESPQNKDLCQTGFPS